jgi:transcriptional regulator with XRE-family HTH domain
MTVNERVREVRRALKLSQRAFAKAIYISNGHYADIELGNKPPNDRLIHLIATCFQVNKNWLLSGEGRMFNAATEQKLERVTALFSELYPEFQDFVLRQIEELIRLQTARGEGEE